MCAESNGDCEQQRRGNWEMASLRERFTSIARLDGGFRLVSSIKGPLPMIRSRTR